MITLSVRVLTTYGMQIWQSLKAAQHVLDSHCSCPGDTKGCFVDLTELPDRRFEAVVTRPRLATLNCDWAIASSKPAKYRKVFDKSAPSHQILAAIKGIITVPLVRPAPAVFAIDTLDSPKSWPILEAHSRLGAVLVVWQEGKLWFGKATLDGNEIYLAGTDSEDAAKQTVYRSAGLTPEETALIRWDLKTRVMPL